MPEMPEMEQLFPVANNVFIGVQYISMCPDETAHIRIIGENAFSRIYDRKIHYDSSERHERYFTVSSQKCYLDPKKTRPSGSIQAKE